MPTIILADGRELEVEVSGPDTGPVLLFHHGDSTDVLMPRRRLRRQEQRIGPREPLHRHSSALV